MDNEQKEPIERFLGPEGNCRDLASDWGGGVAPGAMPGYSHLFGTTKRSGNRVTGIMNGMAKEFTFSDQDETYEQRIEENQIYYKVVLEPHIRVQSSTPNIYSKADKVSQMSETSIPKQGGSVKWAGKNARWRRQPIHPPTDAPPFGEAKRCTDVEKLVAYAMRLPGAFHSGQSCVELGQARDVPWAESGLQRSRSSSPAGSGFMFGERWTCEGYASCVQISVEDGAAVRAGTAPAVCGCKLAAMMSSVASR
ncbi:hypothetical protein DFH09DRAFT_1104598 [Mycena vulgaris]|nr:hypothetical protein DFH09DRAFT_1104598 [Mycena vulgaris]